MAEVKTTKKAPVKKAAVKKVATEVKTIDQLNEDLAKALTDLMDARRSNAQGELVNPHVITTTRKSIARLHTAINELSRKETA